MGTFLTLLGVVATISAAIFGLRLIMRRAPDVLEPETLDEWSDRQF